MLKKITLTQVSIFQLTTLILHLIKYLLITQLPKTKKVIL